MIALEKNPLVSEQRGEQVRVEEVGPPEAGPAVCLRHFGWVSVLRTVDKNNDARHYAAFDPRKKKRRKVAWHPFDHAHREHGAIEGSHRALKQVCHAERFFVRRRRAICNHLFCSLRAFVAPELQRWRGEIKSRHALKRRVADEAVTNFIQQRTRLHGA